MTLQGGEKIAGKWAHLKAAAEGGRERERKDTARLRVSEDREKRDEKGRKEGDIFSLCEKGELESCVGVRPTPLPV